MIGENLKKIRKSRNLTQEDVAEMTGLPQSTISYIEKNDASPRVDTLLKLAKGIGIDLSELTKESDSEKEEDKK